MSTAAHRRANRIVVLFAAACVTYPAKAETAFAFTSCPPEVENEVRRIATLELRAIAPSNADTSETSGSDADRVDVSCLDARVQVRILGGKTLLERELDLTREDARIRGRVIALAIADLVALHRSTRDAAPPDPGAPTLDQPKEAAEAKPSQVGAGETAETSASPPGVHDAKESSFSFGLRATTTRFSDDTVPTWGGGAEAWIWFGRWGGGLPRAALGFDLQMEQGTSTPAEGTVERTRLALAGLGLLEVPLGRWLPSLQVGFRLGPVWLQGRPELATDTGLSVSGLSGGPLVAPRLGYLISEHWAVLGSLELGATVLVVEGVLLSGETVRVGGLWWGPQLGVEFRH